MLRVSPIYEMKFLPLCILAVFWCLVKTDLEIYGTQYYPTLNGYSEDNCFLFKQQIVTLNRRQATYVNSVFVNTQ
ncbi:hypothetical protein RJT34_19194 [Clitoria ternatea]|uniref:Uncharacterized protein n=1 Tax=Clitoria ternatea TaxID=43366 RepID=A0AAN9P327_CLITE